MSKEWLEKYDIYMKERREKYKARQKESRRGGGEVGEMPGRTTMEGGINPRHR